MSMRKKSKRSKAKSPFFRIRTILLDQLDSKTHLIVLLEFNK